MFFTTNESKNEKTEKEEKKKETYIEKLAKSMLTIIICGLVILIFLIFFYKPNVIDFIEEIKVTYIYGILIILGLIIFSIILCYILIKDKKLLSKTLKLILFFNILFLIIFFYIEIVLDITYNNEEIFGEFYDTKVENKTDTEQVDILNTLLKGELKTKTEKEVYIEKNLSQFTYFKIKVYLVFILYVITLLINTWIISKIDKGLKARKILEKDDKIIFKNK